MEIKIDSDGIKNIANQLHECSFSLECEIKKITDIVSNISSAWSGDDALKYINIMQDKYILGLEELKDVINEYAIYLYNVPDAYELLDNIYSNKHIEV